MKRANRLSRSRDFDAVYRHGRSVSSRFLVLYWFPQEEAASPRFGFSVPRSVGGAVERNKIKRQLREVWRARLERVPAGNDYVLIVRPGLPDAVAANGFDWLGERVDEVLAMTKAAADVPARRRGASGSTGSRSARSSRRPASTTRPARSTRSTRCARRARCAARCSPAGGCCAATRGATEGSTRSDDRSLFVPRPHSARARGSPRPRLAARHRRPAVGVVDRRPDGDRPHDPRPADGEADPLDAEPAAPRAADEGDPEEVQGATSRSRTKS